MKTILRVVILVLIPCNAILGIKTFIDKDYLIAIVFLLFAALWVWVTIKWNENDRLHLHN